MKSVVIELKEDITDLDERYRKLPCYDGIIDGVPSWYGGLINCEASSGKITFTHDMPNREWDSWLMNAKAVLGV